MYNVPMTYSYQPYANTDPMARTGEEANQPIAEILFDTRGITSVAVDQFSPEDILVEVDGIFNVSDCYPDMVDCLFHGHSPKVSSVYVLSYHILSMT
jgi:hypothetical protein